MIIEYVYTIYLNMDFKLLYDNYLFETDNMTLHNLVYMKLIFWDIKSSCEEGCLIGWKR